MSATPRVIVVDDNAAFLDSMRALLATMSIPVQCYSTGASFLNAYQDNAAACLILDLRLADIDGFAILDALSEYASAPPVIIMTAHADPPSVVRAYRHGIVAFLQKQSFSESDLLDAIHRSFALDEARQAAEASRDEARALLGSLTSDERRVAELVLEGKDHGQIAELLSISRRTVENRMARIREMLGIATLPELVRVFARAAELDD